MGSSFNGLALFDSGPHRFAVAPAGEYVLTKARVDPYQAGSQAVGPLETIVVVRGRLVASSESALWTLRDAIGAQLTDPPTAAKLIDHHGRSWAGMSFVRFEPADRTDRGREFSLAYEATFIGFL